MVRSDTPGLRYQPQLRLPLVYPGDVTLKMKLSSVLLLALLACLLMPAVSGKPVADMDDQDDMVSALRKAGITAFGISCPLLSFSSF